MLNGGISTTAFVMKTIKGSSKDQTMEGSPSQKAMVEKTLQS